MSRDKTVFVTEETYNLIVMDLGYKPKNLKVCNYIPDNQAVIFDEEDMKPKPILYFPTKE